MASAPPAAMPVPIVVAMLLTMAMQARTALLSPLGRCSFIISRCKNKKRKGEYPGVSSPQVYLVRVSKRGPESSKKADFTEL
jgi:hypothetical protein